MLDLKALINRRGDQAKTILDSEVFTEALAEVQTKYINAFANSKVKDSDIRETSYMALRLLKEIEGQLRTYVSDAAYEQRLQEQQNP